MTVSLERWRCPVTPPDEQRAAIAAVRAVLRARANGNNEIDSPCEFRDRPLHARGCFVALARNGFVRGCMGLVKNIENLADPLFCAALLAGTRDPRHPPIVAGEIDDLEIAVWIVHALEPITRPDQIVVGRDGVHVHAGTAHAIYLPYHAVAEGWDSLGLLAGACEKADLAPSAWRAPTTVVRRVTATVWLDSNV